jgi:hypothetical protein
MNFNVGDTVMVMGEGFHHFVVSGIGTRVRVVRSYGNARSAAGDTTVTLFVDAADVIFVRIGNAEDDALNAVLAELDATRAPRTVSAETHVFSSDDDFLSHLMAHSVEM